MIIIRFMALVLFLILLFPVVTSELVPTAYTSSDELGSPLLSPTSDTSGFSSQDNANQNRDGSDVPEGSGDTYFDRANDVWYIDAFSWTGDKSFYSKPAAPLHFVSGELNTYGYNWIYLPYERTGMTYDQGYSDWCAETLASIGQPGPTAGYGLLVDEGMDGGGW